MSDSLWPHGLHSPWNPAGQNTGVGSHSLLQGILPILGSNPGLPHCRRILYQLSHKGSPGILECIAHPFSSKSSWSRNWTGVSCIAGRFLTNWAIREAQVKVKVIQSCLTLCDPMEYTVHGILQPTSLMSPALAGEFFTTEPPGNPIPSLSILNFCPRKAEISQSDALRPLHF